jgi:hypothetical protein
MNKILGLLATVLLTSLSLLQAYVIDLGSTTCPSSSMSDEKSCLNTLITNYNNLHPLSQPLPFIVGRSFYIYQPVVYTNYTSIFTTNFTNYAGYMMIKWGNTNYEVYYFNDKVDNGVSSGNGYWCDGLSKYTFYSIFYPEIPFISVCDGPIILPPPAYGLDHYTFFRQLYFGP